MSCNFDRALLQDYLDRETSPLENLILEGHLRTCRECQAESERLMMLFRSLETPPEMALPGELAQLREEMINRWLVEEYSQGPDSRPGLKTAGAHLSSVLSATLQGQAVWVEQAISFAKYLPGAGTAARMTSKGIQKSSSLAGKALFKLAQRSALAVAASGRV